MKVAQSRLCTARVPQVYMRGVIEADVQALKSGTITSVELARREYDRRRLAAYEVLSAAQIPCSRPSGALYLMADLGNDPKGNPYDAKGFARFLLEEFRSQGTTVMISFAEPFYATPGLGRSQFRLAFVLDEARTRTAANLLVEASQAWKTSLT